MCPRAPAPPPHHVLTHMRAEQLQPAVATTLAAVLLQDPGQSEFSRVPMKDTSEWRAHRSCPRWQQLSSPSPCPQPSPDPAVGGSDHPVLIDEGAPAEVEAGAVLGGERGVIRAPPWTAHPAWPTSFPTPPISLAESHSYLQGHLPGPGSRDSVLSINNPGQAFQHRGDGGVPTAWGRGGEELTSLHPSYLLCKLPRTPPNLQTQESWAQLSGPCQRHRAARSRNEAGSSRAAAQPPGPHSAWDPDQAQLC